MTTYRLYRAALLYSFNDVATKLEEKGKPAYSYNKALAALIIQSAPPFDDSRKEAGEYAPPERARTVRSAIFDRLLSDISTSRRAKSKWAMRTHSFAVATVATGMRPEEWWDAAARPATPEDMIGGASHDGVLHLTIRTAKRKVDEPEWIRTLLIPPGHEQTHILQHMQLRDEWIAESTQAPATAHKFYRDTCTKRLSQTSELLWPGDETRRVTLYTLRGQARANFASVYGEHLTAAMLGHSTRKSVDFYPGKHLANLRTKAVERNPTMVAPGRDCLEKAHVFAMQSPAPVESSTPTSVEQFSRI